jgi:hypothetical protein
MKSTVKTVKGRGRPLGSKNNNLTLQAIIDKHLRTIDQLEKDLERKDNTLAIMRDEIKTLEDDIEERRDEKAEYFLQILRLKDIIRKMAEEI